MADKQMSNVSKVDGLFRRNRILLVDLDTLCLSITASVLEVFNYDVVATKCPLEAMAALRISPDSFDIVIADIEMSLLNDLNFKKLIEQEFQVPVILMATVSKKKQLVKSLALSETTYEIKDSTGNAVFYIVKPPTVTDIKTIGEFVASKKKKNNNIIIVTSNSLENRGNCIQKKQNSEVTKNNSLSLRKHKITWTPSLHDKFLEAVKIIGIHRAVPKKIMEYMNVPGLERSHIASHLQKYRIYAKRLDLWRQYLIDESNGLVSYHDMMMNPNPLYNYGQLGSQGLNLLNTNQNPYLQSSMNNIGANYANNNTSGYNNLTRSGMETFENNNYYVNNGDLNSAAMQFMSPNFGSLEMQTQFTYQDGMYSNFMRDNNNYYMNNMSNGEMYASNNGMMQNVFEKGPTSFDVPSQAWAPNPFDNFSMDYGTEDISAIFSNINAQNENAN